jgi:hypothetical protein
MPMELFICISYLINYLKPVNKPQKRIRPSDITNGKRISDCNKNSFLSSYRKNKKKKFPPFCATAVLFIFCINM